MKKRVLSRKKILLLGLVIIFTGMFIYSAIKIAIYLQDNKTNRDIQKKIVTKAISINDAGINRYQVDFKILKEQNSDSVAYLKVENTNIDYIVVKGNDNSYYLNHNFNKKDNVSGWIFADYRNKFDGSDKNIIIYGHNTWDGSMFGSLHKVFDSGWYRNILNHKIMLVTEDKVNYYQVFSTYYILAEDYYITTNFNNDSEYEKFVKNIKSRTSFDYGVDVNSEDKILTLSTCSGDGKQRVVLHAKLIDG